MRYHVILPDDDRCLFCGMSTLDIHDLTPIEGCSGQDVDTERVDAWLRSEGIAERDLDIAREGFVKLHRDPISEAVPIDAETQAELRKRDLHKPQEN